MIRAIAFAEQCAERVREWGKRGSDVTKITSTGGVLSQQGRGLEGHFHPEEIRVGHEKTRPDRSGRVFFSPL